MTCQLVVFKLLRNSSLKRLLLRCQWKLYIWQFMKF